LPIRECTHDPCATPDLAQDALERIVAADTTPMLLGERRVAGIHVLNCEPNQKSGWPGLLFSPAVTWKVGRHFKSWYNRNCPAAPFVTKLRR
jgi:hypothetical protein